MINQIHKIIFIQKIFIYLNSKILELVKQISQRKTIQKLKMTLIPKMPISILKVRIIKFFHLRNLAKNKISCLN